MPPLLYVADRQDAHEPIKRLAVFAGMEVEPVMAARVDPTDWERAAAVVVDARDVPEVLLRHVQPRRNLFVVGPACDDPAEVKAAASLLGGRYVSLEHTVDAVRLIQEIVANCRRVAGKRIIVLDAGCGGDSRTFAYALGYVASQDGYLSAVLDVKRDGVDYCGIDDKHPLRSALRGLRRGDCVPLSMLPRVEAVGSVESGPLGKYDLTVGHFGDLHKSMTSRAAVSASDADLALVLAPATPQGAMDGRKIREWIYDRSFKALRHTRVVVVGEPLWEAITPQWVAEKIGVPLAAEAAEAVSVGDLACETPSELLASGVGRLCRDLVGSVMAPGVTAKQA